MEIEGFNEIISTITLAKELHSIGRYDIVQKQFFDTVSWDSYFENMLGAIMSVFSGFYSNYDDGNETERMIFTDYVISDYFNLAYEYGRKYKIPHAKNPFVIEAESEARRCLNFCYTMDWALLSYTKTKRAARKSKLIILTCAYEFAEHDYLAYGLLKLYTWFADKCTEFKSRQEVIAA